MKCPLGVGEHKFKKWQEAMRKCIERAFGVLQIKFQCLKNPCRKHDLKDAEDMMMACICLHNMMVEHRIERHETEDSNFYQIVEDESLPVAVDSIQSQVNKHYAGRADELSNEVAEQIRNYRRTFVDRRRVILEARWGQLHDIKEHNRLTAAISRHISSKD